MHPIRVEMDTPVVPVKQVTPVAFAKQSKPISDITPSLPRSPLDSQAIVPSLGNDEGTLAPPVKVLVPTPDQAVDTRPECKYGALCYRTNPDHLKQFKHPLKEVQQPAQNSHSSQQSQSQSQPKPSLPPKRPLSEISTEPKQSQSQQQKPSEAFLSLLNESKTVLCYIR